jgi:hypothetical protein
MQHASDRPIASTANYRHTTAKLDDFYSLPVYDTQCSTVTLPTTDTVTITSNNNNSNNNRNSVLKRTYTRSDVTDDEYDELIKKRTLSGCSDMMSPTHTPQNPPLDLLAASETGELNHLNSWNFRKFHLKHFLMKNSFP